MTTVAEQIAKLTTPAPEPEIELEILRELPPTLAAPTLSNIRKNREGEEVSAWVSFHAPSYDPNNTWNPAQVAADIESAGWQLMPATLVKWDNYRPSPFPGLMENVPDTHGRYKLSDAWPIAPVWVTPCQFTGPDAQLFMRTKAGLIVRVSIDLPRIVQLSARRIEYRGNWRYERGTARVHHPDSWHAIHDASGRCMAQKAARCHATVDTEQGLSAAIYWEPCEEQSAFNMPAAEFIAALIRK